MRKPISTLMHGAIDYLTVASLATLPKLLGFSQPLTCAMQTMAVGKLCYTLFTDNELGVVRKIPMKAHLAVDAVSGATLAALPFVLDEDDPAALATCVGIGLCEIMNAPMTQTTPSDRDYARQALRGTARLARGATQRVRQTAGAGGE